MVRAAPHPVRPGPPGRRVALVVVLAVLGALLGQLPATAALGDAVPVPASGSGSFTIAGHGNGHGHGLSQYGAQGAGLHGVPLAMILAHYYPGTALRALPDSPIRVLLAATASPGGVLVVSPASGLTATDLATGRSVVLPVGPALWRAARAADGSFRLQGLAAGTWTSQPLLGPAPVGPLGFAAASTVRLWPAGPTQTDVRALPSRAYRGRLELRTVATGGTAVVDVVAMESYLRAVVPLETRAPGRT